MKRLLMLVSMAAFPLTLWADGLVLPPVAYRGSLNETAQEAILIFHGGSESAKSSQDLILKISVEGETKEFGWVVPLPGAPESGKADAAMFKELHDYVQARTRRRSPKSGGLDTAQEGRAVTKLDFIAREAPLARLEDVKSHLSRLFDLFID